MLEKYLTTEPSCLICVLQTMHVMAHVWRLEDILVESVLASAFRCFAFGGSNSGNWAFTSAFPALAGPSKIYS